MVCEKLGYLAAIRNPYESHIDDFLFGGVINRQYPHQSFNS